MKQILTVTTTGKMVEKARLGNKGTESKKCTKSEQMISCLISDWDSVLVLECHL